MCSIRNNCYTKINNIVHYLSNEIQFKKLKFLEVWEINALATNTAYFSSTFWKKSILLIWWKRLNMTDIACWSLKPFGWEDSPRNEQNQKSCGKIRTQLWIWLTNSLFYLFTNDWIKEWNVPQKQLQSYRIPTQFRDAK